MLLAPLCRCGKLSFFSVRDVRESGCAGFSRKCSTVVSAARQKLLNFRSSSSLKRSGKCRAVPMSNCFVSSSWWSEEFTPFFQSSQAKSLNFPNFEKEKKEIFFSFSEKRGKSYPDIEKKGGMKKKRKLRVAQKNLFYCVKWLRRQRGILMEFRCSAIHAFSLVPAREFQVCKLFPTYVHTGNDFSFF